MEQALKEIIEKRKINYIDSLEKMNTIYNVELLKQENKTEIFTEKNQIVIFDTNIYNSCYVLDVLDAVLNPELNYYKEVFSRDEIDLVEEELKTVNEIKEKVSKVIESTDICYCDDFSIYSNIFSDLLMDFEKVEKDKQMPIVLIVNKDTNTLLLDGEGLSAFTIDRFIGIFLTQYKTSNGN